MKKLNWSLYGLKDTAEIRNELFFKAFNELGLREMEEASCVFFKNVTIVCYVDNFITLGRNENKINTVEAELNKRFKLNKY